MKVLLLGEYSALHKNLKEGLIELGHDVTVASTGDGWKKIENDISLSSKLPSYAGKVVSRFKPYFLLDALSGFDVVQLINPFIFYTRGLPNKYLISQLKKRNSKIFLLGAGDDSFFWNEGRDALRYSPCDDFLKYDHKKSSYWMASPPARDFNEYVAGIVNGIIPIMYEYEVGYKEHWNIKKTIPIPINTAKIPCTPNILQKKLVVFHGLNRYGFKGTRHVEEAFSILAKKYPDELELVIDGKMPLRSYMAIMERANIVVDQVYSHSCGVNGVLALAMGKVVLGGAEPESLHSIGVTKTPVINIEPCAADIVLKIERLLANRSDITVLGLESRAFVEDVHDYKKVARQYLDLWGEC